MDPYMTRQLGRTNVHLTQLGLGCASIGSMYGYVEEEEGPRVLEEEDHADQRPGGRQVHDEVAVRVPSEEPAAKQDESGRLQYPPAQLAPQYVLARSPAIVLVRRE